MEPFLKLVADDLHTKFKGNFEDIAIVFPNKRAGLFFNKYLLEKNAGKPMWSPHYMTISELFAQSSNLTIADSVLLVSKLYREYVRPQRPDESNEEYEKSVESLDSFYYWGEMLLRDFDDIDKHLADPKQLFTNIKELKEMGTAKDTLGEEEKKALALFFENFKEENESKMKSKFIDIWLRLFPIYTKFKETLRREFLAYEGMLYRDVIENPDNIVLKYDKYIFVGFNALSDVEIKLFAHIKGCGKALFYWDYDNCYIKDSHNEAGHFMRSNLERFPGEIDKTKFNNLTGKKNVTIVQTGSDSIGVRYLSKWLDDNLTKNEIETAVVLCDETMLEATLHTIPSKENGTPDDGTPPLSINVTMGYPLANTPIYGLVRLLVDLQTRGWSEKQNAFSLSYVCNVLKHPYIIQGSPNSEPLREKLLKKKIFYPTEEELSLDEFLKLVFTRTTDNTLWMERISQLIYDIARRRGGIGEEKQEVYDELFTEAILKVHTQAQRLIKMLDSGELRLRQATLGRLFTRMLTSQTMPFHGEPVVGLQIMGLLETRNLDFKNVILLGVNEGNLPKKSSENSYIPYNLRRAFGLTLSEHRDSIYSYYFYRLLQRAENVTLVYNNSSDSKTRGECSRYILQLLGSKLYNIKKVTLTSQQNSESTEVAPVEKNKEIIDALRKNFDSGYSSESVTLTPSAINRYLRCGLDFYFYYVMGIRPIEELDESFEANDFGTIFHRAAEDFYKEMKRRCPDRISSTLLKEYIDNPALLYKFVDDAFKEEFFKGNKPVYNGEQYINRGVIHHFLLRLLKMDAEYTPFNYVAGEKKIFAPYLVKVNDMDIKLQIGGTIDRVDIKGDTINIVDYKTGGGEEREPDTTLEDIFALGIKTAGHRLQAFLYSIVMDDVLKNGIEGTKENKMDWLNVIDRTGSYKISPSLLYVNKKENSYRDEYVIQLGRTPVKDITTLKEKYMALLNGILEEIFSIDKPFTPACDSDRCKYCDYKKICMR